MAQPRDAAAVHAIYAPVVRDTAISFEEVPPTPDEIAQRIAEVTRRTPWLVAEEAGGAGVLGYAYAAPHRDRPAYRWAVDVSVYVHEDVRRRGVARTLYATLLPLVEAQGFTCACAGIALPNPASVALHASFGFEPVGVYRGIGFKLGAWRDVGWWQRPLAPRGVPPTEPRPIEIAIARLAELLAHDPASPPP